MMLINQVLDEKTISRPIFGNIIPKKTGGAKTLLLIAFNRNKIFNASTCADNCSKWILKLAEDRKAVINLRHLMDFGQGEFKIRVLNTGKMKNMLELVEEAGEFI